MLQTEERSERIATTRGVSVDGVIRVRSIRFERGDYGFRFERREPVAVVVERAGHTERLAIRDGSPRAMRLAWFATPLAAWMTARVLRRRGRKGA